ncbi:3-deoxy-D-manno-octulosonic acid transferase [Cloacibacterium rupense]|uniref:3-deoxy-D-manno-octulosonic acid transferase n=1 Tax=Cloacibacterium rupense TaxID=517423 RepID=A0ABQ2NI02_9FLAO|nr:glycosyltransferase N-terminal domain-containing protein [Cloacibacterium rupense]GGP02736.1 3-deoxy-D-manno-octulosonic acid transferase [Cloacibacterium rupense]
MKHLYNISIFHLELAFKVLSWFNDKIKRGLEGRKHSLEIIESKISKDDNVIWMHAASLGEYEQGLPVLEKLKEKYPNHKVLVTFFSPSGYENVVKKNKEDILCYLPFDKKNTISEFVKAVKPEIFFTVKYDFWYHLLDELKKNGAKVFVVSALFYDKQVYFKPQGKWFVNELKKNVDWIFHQTEKSFSLAQRIGLTKGSVSGDTRFDRVKQIKNRNNSVEFIDEFKADKKLLVFGSSWEAEEKIARILSEKLENFKMIIAPHDLKRVQNLKQIFSSAILYSEIAKSQNRKTENEAILQLNDFTTTQILIIDSIGLLSKLYSYADIAIVGGGFHDKGLHNILEAATFGIPVLFGNQYKKNPEADGLIAQNGGKSFTKEESAADFVLELTKNSILLNEMSQNAEKFVHTQPNSSELILKKILE